ncbi:MAG: hypothetical protein AAFX06_13450 [Planctomycetota bacterium]
MESPRARRKRLEREAIDNAPTTDSCRDHPEFNRLSYVFRGSLDANNLHAARQAFVHLDSLQIAMGLSDQYLMKYALALGVEGLWVDAIRPFVLIGGKRGPLADDAYLRLAKIQLEILKRPDLAMGSLNQIQPPEEGRADAAKKERLKKRNELLKLCAKA